MITITREENKVKGKITTTIDGGWWYTFTIYTCEREPYAILLTERMQKDLADKLESIRREEYDRGWKDAKAKKGGKRTWFKSWW